MFLTEGMGSQQGLPRTEGQERWKLIGLGTLVPFQGTHLSDVFHGYTLKWMWLSYWEVEGPSSSLSCPWSCCSWGAGVPCFPLSWLEGKAGGSGSNLMALRIPSGGPSDRAPLWPGTSVQGGICEGDGDEGLSGLSPTCWQNCLSERGFCTLVMVCCCCCSVPQLCSTPCDPKDCSLPGSSVHGISQARILEWVAILFPRGSSQPRDWTHISSLAGGFFTTELPVKTWWWWVRGH